MLPNGICTVPGY